MMFVSFKRDNIYVWQLPLIIVTQKWWYLEQSEQVSTERQHEWVMRETESGYTHYMRGEKIMPGPNEKITAYTSETDSRAMTWVTSDHWILLMNEGSRIVLV